MCCRYLQTQGTGKKGDFIENCWSEDFDEKKGSFWKVAKDSLDMSTKKTDYISYEGKGRGAKYVWNDGT